jgi:hypothetical protein
MPVQLLYVVSPTSMPSVLLDSLASWIPIEKIQVELVGTII